MADEILLHGPLRDAVLSGPGGIPYQAGPDGALRVRPAHLAWARDLGFAPDAPDPTSDPEPTPEPATESAPEPAPAPDPAAPAPDL